MAKRQRPRQQGRSRFELDVEGAVAFANYRLAPSTVIITHTETPPALRGRGIAWSWSRARCN